MELADQYASLVEQVMLAGQEVSPRGRPNLELRACMIRTRPVAPCLPKGSGVNYRFALAEAMAVICGWNDVEWLEQFNPTIAQFSDDGDTFHGAYGCRMDLESIIKVLSADRHSRQAVTNIWQDPKDLGVVSKDLPCNTQLMVKIRDDVLCLSVMRRSGDLIWGVPYDHFVWASVGHILAASLDCNAVELNEYVDSLHVYKPEAKFYDTDRVTKAAATKKAPRVGLFRLITRLRDLEDARRTFEDVRDGYAEGDWRLLWK